MKKKALILGAALLVLTACGSGEKTTDNVNRDTLVAAQSAELRTLDPHQATDVYSRRLLANIFDRLIEKNEQMELVPGLAKSWKYLDDTSVEFKLREGVLFQNGSELTSEDVKYTLETAKTSPMVGMLYEAIDEVEVVDKYTLIVKTTEPFGPLLHHLSHITASIMNKEYNESTEDYNIKPMGTGPYMLERWVAGDRVILKSHKDYFRGEAPIENVVVRNIPEENSRVIGLETGEVHLSQDILSISRMSILGDPSLELQEMSALGISYMGFNVQRGVLQDKRIRQAIAYAINRDEIIDTILMGSVEKANGLFGPGVFGYSEEAETIGFDLEKAKSLLADAGYPNGGIDLLVTTSGSETNTQIMTIVQAQLKEIGIDLTLQQLEWGAFLNSTANGETDLFYMGWSNSSADGDYGMSALLHGDLMGASGNRSFYRNERLDKLLGMGRRELDEEVRRSYYAEAMDIVNEDVPIYPFSFALANAGYQKSIKGYEQSPLNNPNFFKLSFE